MIVLTGPESTGKTTLADALGRATGARTVSEVARSYLMTRGPDYLPSDLLTIARRQRESERCALDEGGEIVADTDLQVICIWWQERFGPLPHVLATAYADQSPRGFLLCSPDIEWTPDPLRENPDDRARLFAIYQRDLERRQLPYRVVSGQGEARLSQALRARSALLSELGLG